MSLLQNSNAISSGGYDLTDSVRFRSSASAYLSRTPTTASNRKTWTMSMWVKRGNNAYQQLAYASESPTYADPVCLIGFSSDTIDLFQYTSSFDFRLTTTQVFRDPSAWYHIVWSVDTTQATSTNRVKLYVNGEQVTSFTTATYPSLNFNTAFNYTGPHLIAARGAGGSVQEYFDGYMTEVNFVDGQALTASDFGETATDTGVWKPKKYTGTYGTNGFYLPMKQTTQAEGFNTVTYTGNGTNISVNRVGFQPDLIWVKNREQPDWHHLFDSVRGLGRLSSNDTANEYVDPPVQQLQSYNTDGFTYGTSSSGNASGEDYVAWCWEAGGTASSNTDGTITSSVSANTAKGFSVVTYTGNGSTGTVGHGLGSAPEMIIIKNRSQADGWYVWHQSNAAGIFGYLFLNSTDQVRSSTPQFGSTAPDSSVISLTYNTNDWANASGENYVAYCFSEVSGFSKFGTYTGNGTSQSINLGFRPAFVMWKRTDAAGNSWIIKDNTRYADNKGNLFPNATTVENTDTSVTFTDTGFDVDSALGYNGSGRVFIYMAFADTRDYQWNFDASGNKNNWTPNNINSNASSDTTYDIMSDVPTLTDEDTANYATLNPLIAAGSVTVSLANLKATSGTNAQRSNVSTISVSSGKYYWETTWNTVGANDAAMTGIIGVDNLTPNSNFGGTNSYAYVQDGGKQGAGSYTGGYGDRYVAGDVIGTALDLDAGTITFYRNGTTQGTAFTSLPSVEYYLGCSFYNSGDNFDINFGQRPFAYTPPTGYKKLNTYNLPDSAIKDGSDYMNTITWSGDNTSPRTLTGVGFEPDLVWTKGRSNATSHQLFDSVRGFGSNKELSSNQTTAEGGDNSGLYGYVSASASDGFQVTTGTTHDDYVNDGARTYVAWNWRGSDSAAVSNTDGSITSTVSANTTSGFSIVTFTGTGVITDTIGHGLGTTPEMMFVRGRSVGSGWWVYHKTMGNGKFMYLNTTQAETTSSGVWNNTSPTSTVFVTGGHSAGVTMVVYCFASVEGYSKIGSYTGNGSTDGPFIYTGFKPAFVMFKRTDTTSDWNIIDTARNTYNLSNLALRPNTSGAESTYSTANSPIDFISNGFKLRGTGGDSNASGGTYIYMAFASNPLKHSLAR